MHPGKADEFAVVKKPVWLAQRSGGSSGSGSGSIMLAIPNGEGAWNSNNNWHAITPQVILGQVELA